jgi:hypothetical protein
MQITTDYTSFAPGMRMKEVTLLRLVNGVMWLCRCRCGREVFAYESALVRRHKVGISCGCIAGKPGTSINANLYTYKSWLSARQRCTIPSTKAFEHYGGRGIKFSDRWLNSFDTFLRDMGHRPFGLSLDRIDPDGDYEPANCRWVTRVTQGRNKFKANEFGGVIQVPAFGRASVSPLVLA